MKKASKTNYSRTRKKVFILGIGLILVASGWYFISAINNTGLVLHYTFDNESISGTTVYDQSGRGNHGTITIGSGATGTEGRIGEAMEFDGSSSYVDVPIATLTGMESEGTIAMWVKADWSGMADNEGRLMGSEHTAGGNSEFRGYGSTRPTFLLGYGADYQSAYAFGISPNATDYNNQWVFIHYEWYESGGSYYIKGGHNGGWVHTSDAVPSAFVMPDTEFSIGKWSTKYFPGSIDELRIYNRALSEDEIQNIYNNTATKYQVQTPNKSGLVGYWNFDSNDTYENTVYDKSGYGNNGTITIGSGATGTEGRIGEAMEFDGSSSLVNCGDNSSVRPTDAITVSAWAYMPTTPASVGAVYGNAYASGGSEGNAIYWGTDNKIDAYVGNGATIEVVPSDGPLSLGAWHHILMRWQDSDDELSLWIDGIKQTGTGTLAGPLQYSAARNLLIGASLAGSVNFPGSIDDVRIYNRALSEDEILNIYQSTGKKFKVHSPNKTGLVGYWNFDSNDTYATTTYDKSGYGNHGDIINGTATGTEGVRGEAFTFDGEDDYVNCGNDNSLDITDAITISLWMKSSVAEWAHLTQKGNANYNLYYDPDGLVTFRIQDGGNPYTSGNGALVTDGLWHYVVGTYDGSDVKIYVDGDFKNSGSHTGDIDNNSDDFLVPHTSASGRYDGLIDEVRIYNRALSEDEILNNYLYSQKTHINY